MLNSDVVTIFMEQVPEDVRSLRDGLAKAEIDNDPTWERRRELQGRIKDLKNRCEESAHSLIIVLAGNVGTRRRLMRNERAERRTCIMCGTEEVGTLATGSISHFMLRRAEWKFDRLNGYVSRTFADPQWYFETLSVIRNFSFSTDVVLQHAFPPQIPVSLSSDQGKPR